MAQQQPGQESRGWDFAMRRCRWADRCDGEPVAILTVGHHGARDDLAVCAWHMRRLAVEPLPDDELWWDWIRAKPIDAASPWAPAGLDPSIDVYDDFPRGMRQAAIQGWDCEEPRWWFCAPPRASSRDGIPDLAGLAMLAGVALLVAAVIHGFVDAVAALGRTAGQ